GGVAQLRHALGQHCRQEDLFGRADARVGQFELGSVQAIGGGDVQALGGLLHLGAELAQCGEMEVDGSISDAASAKVGYERVPQAVQERATEQDRDPARPGVHVDLVDAGTVHVGRIEDQLARLVAVGHPYAVQLQQATHDLHIPDAWHVVEATLRLAEQRRYHRLRYEVL